MMVKIIRKSFSPEFFKMFLRSGIIPKTKIEGGYLPEDAEMIHMEFNPSNRTIDFYFVSQKESYELPECAPLNSVDATSIVLRNMEGA